MKVEKVLKYELSENEQKVLDEAREIINTLNNAEILEHSSEFHYICRDNDLQTCIDTIEQICSYSGDELTFYE